MNRFNIKKTSAQLVFGISLNLLFCEFARSQDVQDAAVPAGTPPSSDVNTAPSSPAADQPAPVPTPAAPQTKPAPAEKSDAPSREELERRVDILTSEVQSLKELLVIPEKDEYKSWFGLGPAASKVYGVQRGLSIGGYSEFYLDFLVGDKRDGLDYNLGDYLRYVQYIGYKFSDKFVANAEIEIEHSTTGTNYAGQGGSVSVEFGYLDYMADRRLNIRFGLVLIPMGFLNEMHEPPFYHGNFRPEVEQVIIPSTWRELGGGFYGELIPGLTYKLYAVTGMNAEKFTDEGWRGGRQNGGRPLIESWGVVGRADYTWNNVLTVGSGVYFGGADQDRITSVSSDTLLVEGHAQLRYQGLELRALGAYGHLSDAGDLTNAIFPTPTDAGAPPETRVLANDMYGWYFEAAYDVMHLFDVYSLYLAPYFRYERFNTQASTPSLPGRAANSARDRTNIEAGLTFKPHPQIAVKLNYRDRSDEADTTRADSLVLGAGFMY